MVCLLLPIRSSWIVLACLVFASVTQDSCCAATETQPSPAPNQQDKMQMDKFPREGCSESACTSHAYPRPRKDCIVPPDAFNTDVQPMTCDKNSVFKFPHLVGEFKEDDPAIAGKFPPQFTEWYFAYYDEVVYYTCCETSEGSMTTPYQRMNVFYWSYVPIWILSILAFLVLANFVRGILSHPALRRQGFSIYLVSLSGPDIILNAFVTIFFGARIMKPAQAYGLSPSFNAYLLALNTAFSAANSWMSAVIAYEIFSLLLDSSKRRRAKPPTIRRVIMQTMAVYVYSIIPGIMTHATVPYMIDYPGIVATIMISITWGVPILYLLYVCFRIWREGLLPRTKRTRGITLYFGRIILLFLIMLTPTNTFGCSLTKNNVLTIMRHYLRALHGIVSVAAARMNPEIRDATSFTYTVPLNQISNAFSSYFFRLPPGQGDEGAGASSQIGGGKGNDDDVEVPVFGGRSSALRHKWSDDEEVIDYTYNGGAGGPRYQASSLVWPEEPEIEDSSTSLGDEVLAVKTGGEPPRPMQEEGNDAESSNTSTNNSLSCSLSEEEEKAATTPDCFVMVGGDDSSCDPPPFSSCKESEVVNA